MKYPSLKLLGALAAALALAGTSQAASITGSLDFAGGATLNTSNLGTATQVIANGFTNVKVQNVTAGSVLDSTINVNDTVTMTSSAWNFASGALAGLWSVGGFTFDLISSSISVQNGVFLNVSGTGTITGNGYEATNGSWYFTSQGTSDNPQFSFSATSAGVPDGGTTAGLLGLALMGLALARRRFV
jgi:hypothetical protein